MSAKGQNMKKPIDSFTGAYRFLSNFYDFPFTDARGRVWPTVEHYYQAHKTTISKEFRSIRQAKTPGEAKRLGSQCELRDGWNTRKIALMRKALRYKFWQNTPLRVKLIETYPRELIEGNTWGDTYWGVCKGVGENMLGFLLTQLRDEYKRMYDEGWDISYPYYEQPIEQMKRVRKPMFEFDPSLLKPRR